jgi:hypothetical protein
VACKNKFIGRASAQYCSPACKQRAHRGRQAATGNSSAPRVTVTIPADQGPGHTAEALALLASLTAEMAENSEELGEELEFPAAEQVALEMAMCAIDRKADLYARYHASDDDKLRVKLSAEIRLLEASVDRLLKRVNTDLPVAPSRVSQKASEAVNVRWRSGTR